MPRLDLTPLTRLVPAMWAEWDHLRFEDDGALRNPMTGAPEIGLSLVRGSHRGAGAEYQVTLEQDRAPSAGDAARFVLRLADDDGRRLACSISPERGTWSLDVTVTRAPLPRVELRGRIDLTATLRRDGMPGCLASLIGGTAHTTAVVELASVERGGQLVEADARANRLRGDAQAVVRTAGRHWALHARGSLAGRGLARPVLLFARRSIRRQLDRSLAEFWASSERHLTDLATDLAKLDAGAEAEGGPASFVHRWLWDEAFAGGLQARERVR